MEYIEIIETAIQQLTNEHTLAECIAEECIKRKIDFKDMAKWIKKNKALFDMIEKNAEYNRVLNNDKPITDAISISEYF